MVDVVETAVRSAKTHNPKTVLGFFGIVIGIVVAACSTFTTILATTNQGTWLIPWIVLGGAAFVVVLTAALFVVMLVNPSKLMLMGVTGTEFMAIQTATLGDSRSGIRPAQNVLVIQDGAGTAAAGNEINTEEGLGDD